jgi:hypothetical protein
MIDRSHVVRRGERATAAAFPARPTLAPEQPCDGVAFVLDAGSPFPDLRPFREVIGGLWRGPLEGSAGAPVLLVASFIRPTPLGGALSVGLPLAVTRSATLASFADDLDRPRMPGPVRRLDLWWGGRRRQIALDALAPVSIATLWTMPDLKVHAPPTPPAAPDAGTAPDRPLAQISRARVAMRRDGEDLIGQVDDQLRQLEARTKLSSILKQLLEFRPRGRVVGDSRPGASGGDTKQRPRQPGVLENLAGWIRWHTPLGARLKRSYAQRLNLVEKLIASGDLDGALKLALALGGGLKDVLRNRFPNALPGSRSALDFSFTAPRAAAPILGGDAFLSLQARYNDLARKLERDGDYRRAAYIHSQLLGAHRQAVLTLEAGGLFREGAKLAIDAKLEPSLAIRLLFQAGELDAALALAKRAGCFDQLAEDSRASNGAFHAYVMTAWTDMLIATGQPLRALQVTDALAQSPEPPGPILDARAHWLRSALTHDMGPGFRSELAARAVLAAPWNDGEGLLESLEDFPDCRVAHSPFAPVLDWMQQIIRSDAEDDPALIIDLLSALARFADPDHGEQTAFWQGPAQMVLDAFARALFEIASNRLGQAELEAAQALLKRAELGVLAADIGKLRKLHAVPAATSRTLRISTETAIRPVVRHACVLGDGGMLVWRESRLLQLLDRQGAVRWQRSISDVAALIPVGGGSNVILIQSGLDGLSMLTRFSTHERAFYPIGRVSLTAHHDAASESQWLVQIGGEIGGLDLAKLCAPDPQVEFLWSCALTERVRAVAFGHHPQAASWITRDVSDSNSGVLELWSLRPSGEMTTSLCLPAEPASPASPPPMDWYWVPLASGGRIAATGLPKTAMNIVLWNNEIEKRARKSLEARRSAGWEAQDVFQSCDFGRPFIVRSASVGGVDGGATFTTSLVEPDAKEPTFSFEHATEIQLTCLARGAASPRDAKQLPAAHICMLADNLGRVFVVDLRTLNVATL